MNGFRTRGREDSRPRSTNRPSQMNSWARLLQHMQGKTVACVLVCVSFVGCCRHLRSSFSSSNEFKPVPMQLILQVPMRMAELKYGMSREEAFRTLRLDGYSLIALVLGPLSCHAHRYELQEGYELEMVFNETNNPPSLIMSRLVGRGWND